MGTNVNAGPAALDAGHITTLAAVREACREHVAQEPCSPANTTHPPGARLTVHSPGEVGLSES